MPEFLRNFFFIRIFVLLSVENGQHLLQSKRGNLQ